MKNKSKRHCGLEPQSPLYKMGWRVGARHDELNRIFKSLKTLILILCISGTLHAQNNQFKLYEDSLKAIGKNILATSNDSLKSIANQQFIEYFETILRLPESFDYPFDSLTTITKIIPNDKSFRILNWTMPKDDGTYEYFGYVQCFTSKKKYLLFPLIDKRDDIKNVDNAVLDNSNWNGALYYKVIETSNKKKKQYILLGWDGNTRLSTKKIIEPISFTNKGIPKFGASVFAGTEKKSPKRIIFEYGKNVAMSLKYYESENQIIFDHLSPSDSRLKGQYQFYGPDMSIDAFEFTKGKWVYIKDVDARNNKKKEKNNERKKEKEVYKPK